jgi:NAD+ kinase
VSPAKTAFLVSHSYPPETAGAVERAAAMASESGWRIVATAEERGKHGEAAGRVEEVKSAPEDTDLCLVLGGDGSILHALRLFAGRSVPVFGVNYGTMGFLAATEREAEEEGLRRALAGEFEALPLPGIEVTTPQGPRLGFNDVSFTRRPHGRVAELAYGVGDEEVGHVRCDGLVVATPTGSTGYNLANGGPILAWGVEGYVVSYVAPHTLTARALVVAPSDVLGVGNARGRDPVDVAVDGEPVGDLGPGAEAEIRFRADMGTLAQLPGTSFYYRIREKFGHLAV